MAIATEQQSDIFGQLANFLRFAGLDSLFTVGPDGTPSGWLWDQIVSGINSADQLAVAIEATPQFQARYPAIIDLRQRAANGEPVQIPTVAQVREYEDTTTRLMRNAGLPAWFYDSYTDSQNLMTKGLSAAEVEQRLGTAWERVQSTDPSIRQAYSEFYGVAEGDAALAATFLDPAHTTNQLEKASRAAYTAGMGRNMGVNVDQALAERFASLPKTDAGIYQDLTDIAGLSPVATESITETKDITSGDLAGAVAFGDGNSKQDIQRRILERQANEKSSSGGGALTQRGLTGVSTS